MSSPSLGRLRLGLYIAKTIVDPLAGSIRVRSKLGADTSFIVDRATTRPSHGKAVAPQIEGTR